MRERKGWAKALLSSEKSEILIIMFLLACCYRQDLCNSSKVYSGQILTNYND